LRTNVKQSQYHRLPRRFAPRNDMISIWYEMEQKAVFLKGADEMARILHKNGIESRVVLR